MPAKSKKQRRFMAAVANNPKFAKKVGVPQAVGEEFMKPEKKFLGGLLGRKPRTEGQKTRKKRELLEESERLRKEALAKAGKSTAPAKKTPARKTGSYANPAEVKKRNTQRFKAETERLRKEALKKAETKKDRPMPKRTSATSLANAADPKAKRPAKPERPPTTAPRPPKARNPMQLSPSVKMVPEAEKPPRPLRGTVTGKDKASGKLRRNVGEGRDKRANVTREQLKETGMTLRQYLNFMDREGKRPPKKAKKAMRQGGSVSSVSKVKGPLGPVDTSAVSKKKRIQLNKGGMMKSKMKAKGYKAGGALKEAPEGNKGLKKLPKEVRNKMGFAAKGGMMKSKGYAKGGAMKTKGYAKGGAAGGKKQKVRGAGIARKGVRPAKMR